MDSVVTTEPKKPTKPKKPTFKFSANSLKHMEGVDQRLIDVATLALKKTKVDFGIPSTGGLRTGLEQKRLYQEGKTRCDGLVKPSKHQTGQALDVYAYVDGKATWAPESLSAIAAAFKSAAKELGIGIMWGGDWESFKDMPHFELV